LRVWCAIWQGTLVWVKIRRQKTVTGLKFLAVALGRGGEQKKHTNYYNITEKNYAGGCSNVL
jgi:hypothetical protein